MCNGMQDAVEQFLERLRSAWDAGDARTYAAQFTEDATYVIFFGEALIGRDAIERNHVDVFERWQKGTKMKVKVVGIHPLDADSCSVLTIGGIGAKAPIAYDKIQTFTLVRRENQWFCAAFQNTAMREPAKAAYNGAASPS